MNQEIRHVLTDKDLNIQIYEFKDISAPFPAHFHDYYVIGWMLDGTRNLVCNNKSYTLKPKDILLLSPNDVHGCKQKNKTLLYYRSINIPCTVMGKITEGWNADGKLPVFKENVIQDEELFADLNHLYELIEKKEDLLAKEENLYLVIHKLLEKYAGTKIESNENYDENVQTICDYIEHHYDQPLKLEDLTKIAGLSKTTLLRSFI